MKKLFFTLSACFLLAINGYTQRYAVIDSKYILEKLPDYKEAQQKLATLIVEKDKVNKVETN